MYKLHRLMRLKTLFFQEYLKLLLSFMSIYRSSPNVVHSVSNYEMFRRHLCNVSIFRIVFSTFACYFTEEFIYMKICYTLLSCFNSKNKNVHFLVQIKPNLVTALWPHCWDIRWVSCPLICKVSSGHIWYN